MDVNCETVLAQLQCDYRLNNFQSVRALQVRAGDFSVPFSDQRRYPGTNDIT